MDYILFHIQSHNTGVVVEWLGASPSTQRTWVRPRVAAVCSIEIDYLRFFCWDLVPLDPGWPWQAGSKPVSYMTYEVARDVKHKTNKQTPVENVKWRGGECESTAFAALLTILPFPVQTVSLRGMILSRYSDQRNWSCSWFFGGNKSGEK